MRSRLSRVGERLVLRDHHAAVAVAAQVLRREEAERADRRDFAGHPPFAVDRPAGADRLRGVLDDRDARQRRQPRPRSRAI